MLFVQGHLSKWQNRDTKQSNVTVTKSDAESMWKTVACERNTGRRDKIMNMANVRLD